MLGLTSAVEAEIALEATESRCMCKAAETHVVLSDHMGLHAEAVETLGEEGHVERDAVIFAGLVHVVLSTDAKGVATLHETAASGAAHGLHMVVAQLERVCVQCVNIRRVDIGSSES